MQEQIAAVRSLKLSPTARKLAIITVALILAALAFAAFNLLTHRWEIIGPDGPYGISTRAEPTSTNLPDLIPDQVGRFKATEKAINGAFYKRSDSEAIVRFELTLHPTVRDAQLNFARLLRIAEARVSTAIMVYQSPTFFKLLFPGEGAKLWWTNGRYNFFVTAPDEASMSEFVLNLPY